jgi:hypothetical protein
VAPGSIEVDFDRPAQAGPTPAISAGAPTIRPAVSGVSDNGHQLPLINAVANTDRAEA